MTKWKTFKCSCIEGFCELKKSYHEHGEEPEKPTTCVYGGKPCGLPDGWKEEELG